MEWTERDKEISRISSAVIDLALQKSMGMSAGDLNAGGFLRCMDEVFPLVDQTLFATREELVATQSDLTSRVGQDIRDRLAERMGSGT